MPPYQFDLVSWSVRVAERTIGKVPLAREIAVATLNAAANTEMFHSVLREEWLADLRTAIQREATRVFARGRRAAVGMRDERCSILETFCLRDGNGVSLCLPLWTRALHFVETCGLSVERASLLLRKSPQEVEELIAFARLAHDIAA